jgi:hypothetical protein
MNPAQRRDLPVKVITPQVASGVSISGVGSGDLSVHVRGLGVTDRTRREFPVVVHATGTARLPTVSRLQSPPSPLPCPPSLRTAPGVGHAPRRRRAGSLAGKFPDSFRKNAERGRTMTPSNAMELMS